MRTASANLYPTDTMARIMDDPCTSYWIKDQIQRLLTRDALDAARDAKLLSLVWDEYVTEMLNRR